ncbi:MAG TPA: DUF4416 family protein [Gemmataceae bacterium]|nr:DUF4416 family protein [Gemmataceae bacterium]
MARPAEPEPVKLLIAVLWADEEALHSAFNSMRESWGEIDFQGADHAFDMTNYYLLEMGPSLHRRLISFHRLVSPELLVGAKLECNRLEDELRRRNGYRRINLDSGYLDHNKIVLASVKGLGQKIYIAKGIYADFVARYRQRRYQPFEWTFPDFKDGRYDRELDEIRQLYLQQLRELHSKGDGEPAVS